MEDSLLMGQIPAYRPGKAKFEMIYENGRDRLLPTVKIIELGDQKFYDEVFLGHATGMFSPGEERMIRVYAANLSTLIDQFEEFGYKQIEARVFQYNGVKLLLT